MGGQGKVGVAGLANFFEGLVNLGGIVFGSAFEGFGEFFSGGVEFDSEFFLLSYVGRCCLLNNLGNFFTVETA